MAEHMSILKEEMKSFDCYICDANFKIKKDLNIHIAGIHEGKKPFECSICNVKFIQKEHMNCHIASVHEGKKQFNTHYDIEESMSRTKNFDYLFLLANMY